MRRKVGQFFAFASVFAIVLLLVPGVVFADAPSGILVTNLFNENFGFTVSQLQVMPKTTVNSDLYCYGALVTSGNWTGVELSYLLDQAQLTPEVASLQFSASDGYQVAIPMDVARQTQVILAYEKDGQPLSEGLRLVLPGANGASWISMITTIVMSTSGAEYPEAATAGGGAISSFDKADLPTPIPNIVTVKPEPSVAPSPTTTDVSPSPSATLQPNPTVVSQDSSGNGSDFSIWIVYAVVIIVLLGLSGGYFVYSCKCRR